MKKSHQNLAFLAIVIACFLTVLDSTIVNVSLPNMEKYFNTDTIGISWITTSYLISFSALLINFSKIADIFGRKKMFLIGLIVFGISSISCGLATSLSTLIIFRIIQGVGAAILTPLSIPLGIELFGKNSMEKLSIIVGMIISIAAASGPIIGGFLNEVFTYKAVFYVNIPFVVIALILGSLYIKECYDETIEKNIDYIGAILLAIGLATLTFLLVKGNDYGWGSAKIIVFIVISMISIIFFIIYEMNISNPMIEFKLFKARTFTSSIFIIAIFFFAYMPIAYLLNFYLENTLNYSIIKAGLIMGIPSLIALLSTPIISMLTKKMTSTIVSFITIVLIAGGNFMFVFMNKSNHMIIIVSSFILIGLAVRFNTMLYKTTYEEISNDKNGIASGIQNSLRQIAACIAIALVSTLSTHYTTCAIANTKNKVIEEVKADKNLQDQEKENIILMINNKKKDNKVVLQENVNKDYLNEQNKILLEADKIKENEMYKVYNKCFFFTGIIALIGLVIVPFNKRKTIKN